MEDLNTENYKIFLKEVKEYLNNWKEFHIHGLEYLIFLRYISKEIYRFNAIPIKISTAFIFLRVEGLTFKPYATTDIKTVLQRKSWKLK
jgi:hypothetical protein